MKTFQKKTVWFCENIDNPEYSEISHAGRIDSPPAPIEKCWCGGSFKEGVIESEQGVEAWRHYLKSVVA